MRGLVIMLVAVACGPAPVQKTQKISNTELIALMKKSDTQLVDIRTPKEVAKGYIKGAQNIDFYRDDFLAKMDQLDKEKPLAVYCRSGTRSGHSISKLVSLGFKEIYDVTGGFNSWKSEGYPMVKP